jgi:hypothetical protein
LPCTGRSDEPRSVRGVHATNCSLPISAPTVAKRPTPVVRPTPNRTLNLAQADAQPAGSFRASATMSSSFDARGRARSLGRRRELVTIDVMSDDFVRRDQARSAPWATVSQDLGPDGRTASPGLTWDLRARCDGASTCTNGDQPLATIECAPAIRPRRVLDLGAPSAGSIHGVRATAGSCAAN